MIRFWEFFTANEKESRMKRTYQIEERKAIQSFRSHLRNDPGKTQLILPLADIADRLRNGVDHMLFEAELQTAAIDHGRRSELADRSAI